ncbi:MAG: polysaccharide deacetylase family protein [Pseudohongiellaceae bacterium]
MMPISRTLRSLCSATALILAGLACSPSTGADDANRDTGAASDTSAGGNHAVITIYHHVDDSTPPSTSLSPEQFREQMHHLRDNDFTVWPLDRLLQAIEDQSPIPDRTVAITFDDGYISIHETALPMLQELDFPFALFLSTGPIDDNQRGYMNWDQIRELSDAGVMIANHMVSHPHMIDNRAGESDRERVERMREELLHAEQRIEEETGQSHRVLAYPYGEYDPDILQMIEEEDFIALAQNSGAVGHHSDLRALPRFPLAGIFANMNTIPTKLETLAFRVLEQEPRNPVTDSRRPAVTLRLEGKYNPDQLGCYGGSEPLEIEWLDREAKRFRIEPDRDFNSRRWGYNCTAPRSGSDRFYWYSKFWTRSTPDNQD